MVGNGEEILRGDEYFSQDCQWVKVSKDSPWGGIGDTYNIEEYRPYRRKVK